MSSSTFLLLLCIPVLVASQTINCSQYVIDKSTPYPYAYRWFPPNTPKTNNWTGAYSYCNSLCSGCQLAISRNKSTLDLLTNLQIAGMAQYSVKSYSETFLGLRDLSGVWYWLDGKKCDRFNSSDERCGGNVCSFDNSGIYAGIYSPSPNYIDDSQPNNDGTMFCEVPRKLVSFLITL
jgi:hypothetical protein